MSMLVKKNYRKIKCPEYAEYKYIIMDGEIFINVSAKNPTILAKMFPQKRSVSA